MSVAGEVGCDAGVAGLVPAITAPPPAIYALFPRYFRNLVSTNTLEGLLWADGHSTHGTSTISTYGLGHIHMTGKTNIARREKGFSCVAHVDKDVSIDTEQFSLGVWMPYGNPEPNASRFGYPRYGYIDCSRPVAVVFNTAMSHRSWTTLMDANVDVFGTSTEVCAREVNYCAKRLKKIE